MVSTEKAKNAPPASKKERENWKNIPRDAKGRWVKRRSAKIHETPSTKGKGKRGTKKLKPLSGEALEKDIRHTKVSRPDITSQDVTQILDSIESEFSKFCPRCGGDMKFFRIRCGPEKLISVRKCITCNFWLPISE